MEDQRTTKQNAALHRSFALWCDQLNGAGLTVKVVLKPEVEIQWTPDLIKEHLWRPIQKIQLGKQSTTELTTKEVDKVYQTLQHHFGEKFGIELVFASDETE